MSFGELLKQHRERNGMSQQAFAEVLGISPAQLWNLENGRTASPNARILARMVKMLHLSPKQAFMLLKAVGEADKREDGHF